MKPLYVPSIILNEKKVLERLVNATKEQIKEEKIEVPEYWKNHKVFISKLTHYFLEEDIEDVPTSVGIVLEKYGINFKKSVLDKMVKREIKEKQNSKYKDWRLSDIQDSLKIYQSEVDAINKLQTLPAKRLAFAILVLFKIDEYKHKDSTRTGVIKYLDYEPVSYFNYAKVTSGEFKALNEIHQAKIITVPLKEKGLYCNIISDGKDDKVVYKITDNFECSRTHFDKVFKTSASRIILEIKIDTNEHEVHHGVKEINEKRKERNENPIDTKNLRKCLKFTLMSTSGSYWIEIAEDIKNDEVKINQIKEEIRRIAQSYRKLTKTIGSKGIKEEFDKFIDSL